MSQTISSIIRAYTAARWQAHAPSPPNEAAGGMRKQFLNDPAVFVILLTALTMAKGQALTPNGA